MLLTYTIRPCMTDKIITAFSRLIWDSDLVGSRFTLAMAELLWGTMLLLPGDSFNRDIYDAIKTLATEQTWAFIFIASCIIQMYIILSNDLHSIFARIFSMFNAFLWVLVVGSIFILRYPPPPAAMSGELALTITAIWIYIRPYILARGLKK